MEAFSKFDLLERRADLAEGRAEALAIGGLEDQIDQLRTDAKIDAELDAMKAARGARNQQEEGE
jgi:phage shock protein A